MSSNVTSHSMVIKLLGKNERSTWDELTKQSAHSTIFHSLDWLGVAERSLKGRLCLIVCLKGDEIVAGIPFFVSKRNALTFLQSPPGAYMPYLGPIIPNYENLKQSKRESYFRDFWITLEEYIRLEIKPSVVTVASVSDLNDARPFIWAGYHVTPVYDYVGDIRARDVVWEGFSKLLRKDISHTAKIGVEVCEGTFEDYSYVLDSVERRLEERERIVRYSRTYMKDLFETFSPRGQLKVFIAKYQKDRIGGIIFSAYRDKVSIWIGAVNPKMKGIYANDLLTWRIIEWANANGFKYCEIQGANFPSISYFKSRYNFELKSRYYSEKYSNFFVRVLANAYKKYRNVGPYAE